MQSFGYCLFVMPNPNNKEAQGTFAFSSLAVDTENKCNKNGPFRKGSYKLMFQKFPFISLSKDTSYSEGIFPTCIM